MKLTVAQYGVLFGLVALVLIAWHWAQSDAPKPTITNAFSPIQPQTNWTNNPDNPAQPVTSQAEGAQAMSYGAQVFYEPVQANTIRGDGGYEL